jgi:hypothetical protein
VQWIYTHVDGPFKPATTEGEGMVDAMAKTPLAELESIVQAYAETDQASMPALSDG